MPVNFKVICDAATVTGKTIFHIRISDILCKTTLFLHFLKQIGKGREKQQEYGKQSFLKWFIIM